jgi:hypothetical protein
MQLTPHPRRIKPVRPRGPHATPSPKAKPPNPFAPVDTPWIVAGSVIHGTMRPGDLIPAFVEELARVRPKDHAPLRHEARSVARRLARCHALGAVHAALVDQADHVVCDLMNALDRASPEGMHFGAHEGDGSDYGWWKDEP